MLLMTFQIVSLGSELVIIGGPCTKRSSSNKVSGLHILPFPVDTDGKLVAVDVDVIKQGFLEVKVWTEHRIS